MLRDPRWAFCGALLLVATAAGADTQQAAGAEGALLSNTRQLTLEGRRAGKGYFSADGGRMVFQPERDPANLFFQIDLLDFDTGDVERLASAEMAGLLTGTDGERKATAYVASVFDQLGPMPGGDGDSYFQPFTFTAGAETEVVVLRNGGPLSVPVVPGARE